MWCCSGSDRLRVLAAGAVAWLWLGTLFAAPGAAEEKVSRVQVGPQGIVIETADDPDSAEAQGFGIEADLGSGMISIDEDGAGIVRVFADAEVPAGKKVSGAVVAVFGSVTVAGQVDGDVVAVMGSVKLLEGAAVDGDVVAIGGSLDQADDVTVNGESIALGFLPITWGMPALPVLLTTIVVGWLLTLFTTWVFAVLFGARLVRVATMASRRTAASFFLGLFSLPTVLVLVVLLFVTVVGIPLALVLPVAYALLQYAGQIAATYVLGCKLSSRPIGSAGVVGPVVAGSAFVALFFVVGAVLAVLPGAARPASLFFGLLGVLLILGLTNIGTGAFLLSKFGSQPKGEGGMGRSPEPMPGLAAPSAPPAG